MSYRSKYYLDYLSIGNPPNPGFDWRSILICLRCVITEKSLLVDSWWRKKQIFFRSWLIFDYILGTNRLFISDTSKTKNHKNQWIPPYPQNYVWNVLDQNQSIFLSYFDQSIFLIGEKFSFAQNAKNWVFPLEL